jgi:NodT family efflux transporter outer membrane factor (OMF) lipoprotein
MGACAVGPEFERPKPPAVQVYDTPEPGSSDATGSTIAERRYAAADVPAQWWQLFKSSSLDQTLRLAIADSPTLAAANATLGEAREAILVARAGYLPRIGATAGTQRGNVGSSGSPSSAATAYSVGFATTYTFDAFGATSRLVEQQESLAQMQRYQLAAAYLALTGNVVIESLTIASTQLQIATTQDLLADDQRNLDLTQREFEVGAVARADVLTAESQLAADQATLPSLRQQLSAARHALAILVGKTPGEWSAPQFEFREFTLPVELPVSLPSALIRRRPDILASEAQLHAASAAIGIAVAQKYPTITLSALLTRESLRSADLFHDFDTLWTVGGALTQPLYQGGALRAQERAARDAFTAQAASYRQVVLEAFGQVADDLRALEHDAARVAAYERAVRVSGDALALQRASYAAGKTNVLQLIDAERSYAQARLGSVAAEVEQMEDAAQLFVALGGGWWNTSLVPPN